jgi:hypothetical protein
MNMHPQHSTNNRSRALADLIVRQMATNLISISQLGSADAMQAATSKVPYYHTPGCYFLNIHGPKCAQCLAQEAEWKPAQRRRP